MHQKRNHLLFFCLDTVFPVVGLLCLERLQDWALQFSSQFRNSPLKLGHSLAEDDGISSLKMSCMIAPVDYISCDFALHLCHVASSLPDQEESFIPLEFAWV